MARLAQRGGAAAASRGPPVAACPGRWTAEAPVDERAEPAAE